MSRTKTNYWVWSDYYEAWLNVDRYTFDRKKENNHKHYGPNSPASKPSSVNNRRSWRR